MRTAYSFLLGLMVISACFTAEAYEMEANKLIGKYRIVVLCNGVWQTDETDSAGFFERDIAMIEINDGETQFVDQNPHDEFSRIYVKNDNVLISRVSCGTKKEYVLIGKDTDVKRRWQNTLPLDELFGAIDAMPMRQYEMRTRGGN